MAKGSCAKKAKNLPAKFENVVQGWKNFDPDTGESHKTSICYIDRDMRIIF